MPNLRLRRGSAFLPAPKFLIDMRAMQRGASFNLNAVEAEMAKKMQEARRQQGAREPNSNTSFTAGVVSHAFAERDTAMSWET